LPLRSWSKATSGASSPSPTCAAICPRARRSEWRRHRARRHRDRECRESCGASRLSCADHRGCGRSPPQDRTRPARRSTAAIGHPRRHAPRRGGKGPRQPRRTEKRGDPGYGRSDDRARGTS
jgi:hypothetical protein